MINLLRIVLYTASRWTSRVFTILWTYRIVVIALSVLYLAFWQMDQGQDLLVNLNDSHTGVILFYIVISTIATLFWHLPKYLSKNSSASLQSLRSILADVFFGGVFYTDSRDSGIARLLGVLTFLVPAFAVLNVLDKYNIPVVNPGLLFAVAVLFHITIFNSNWIEDTYRKRKSTQMFFHLVAVLCLVITGLLGFLNQQRPRDLVWMCLGLFLMSLAFAIGVSIRRHIEFNKYTKWFIKLSIARWLMGANLVLALLFSVMNFFPYAGIRLPYFTVSALLCGLVFYVLFFSFLLLWGRVTKINFVGFFLVVAVVAAVISTNPFHEVRQIKSQTEQDSLTSHIRGWLEYRNKEINDFESVYNKPYPVFIVNAYGGGIRAAAWTSLVVRHLDEINYQRSGFTFQHHVIAYSGASGGTIGASILCALSSQFGNRSVHQDSIVQFYRRDFLSPVLIGLTGRDFFFATFGNFLSWMGVTMNDREVVQESIWERQFCDNFGSSTFSGEFTAPWKTAHGYEVPILLANTTEIKAGLKGIVAPFILDSADFPGAVIVNRLLKPGNNFRYSTAAFFSARFPLISPAGKMDNAHYFMDGGLKENSGAETARQLKAVIERVIETSPGLRNRVKLFILSLPNTAVNAPEEVHRNIFQLGAPLQALETNWEGNTRVADSLNRKLFSKAVFSMRPTQSELNEFGGSFKAVLPLGWQMSSKALERLVQCVDENRVEAERIGDVLGGH